MLSNSNQPINNPNQYQVYNYNALQQQPQQMSYQGNNFQQAPGYPLNYSQQNYVLLGENQGNLRQVNLNQLSTMNGYIVKWTCLFVLLECMISGLCCILSLKLFVSVYLYQNYPALVLMLNCLQIFFSFIFLLMLLCKGQKATSKQIRLVKIFTFTLPGIGYVAMMVGSLIAIFVIVISQAVANNPYFIYSIVIFVYIALLMSVRYIINEKIKDKAFKLQVSP